MAEDEKNFLRQSGYEIRTILIPWRTVTPMNNVLDMPTEIVHVLYFGDLVYRGRIEEDEGYEIAKQMLEQEQQRIKDLQIQR